MAKVYAFDFDGVLVKNHKELPFFAMKAWKKMGLKAEGIKQHDIIKYRPYTKNALEIYAVLALLKNRKKVSKDVISKIVASERKKAEEFARLFYAERVEFQETNPKKWLSFYERFDFAIKFFNDMAKNSKVYIVSSKDKKTLERLSKVFGIKTSPERILAKEISFDKADHLELIRKKNVENSEILFIDDAIDHLKPLIPKGIKVALASWGYCTKEDIQEAKKLGIPVLDKNNLASLLVTDNQEEIFDIIDENNNVIGQATRREVHSKGLLHRAVHILIANSKGEMLLQKRSMSKDLYRGYWIDAAAGHVDSDETYEETAKRELKEEIGISTKLEHLFDFTKYVGTDNEIIRVFLGKHNGPFKTHKEEVDFVKFFKPKKITEMMKTEKFTPATLAIFEEIQKRPALFKKFGLS